MGSACCLEVRCTSCGTPVAGTRTMTSPTVRATPTQQQAGAAQRRGYDVNKRLVSAASATGIGFSQLSSFTGIMNLPRPMHLKTWQLHQKNYHAGACRAANSHFQEAAQHVRDAYSEMGVGEPDADGCLDISVSFDGSWHKRGRTSNNGIATVIDIITGLILDYEVLSKYCHACEIGPAEDAPEYEEWWHQHEATCEKNCATSSQAMETEAAKRMWGRSIQRYNFRYKEMLSDGDAKAHTAVCEDAPYGPDCVIEKIDCVNHVTKRMGTALRTLLDKQKAMGESIGGRGKLTEDMVKKLQGYYGAAIKANSGNLEAMKQAVWATYFHIASTDEDPHHMRCPAGADSWCRYRRAEAENRPLPPDTHSLPRSIVSKLTPIYKRLGDPELLKRCLSGKTQNSNESFHSMVWRSCPKECWAGRRTVEAAVAVCCPRFNKGSTAILDVLAELDLVAGRQAEECMAQSDLSRVQNAARKSSEKAKKRRKTIEAVRRQERGKCRATEGETYAAGAF